MEQESIYKSPRKFRNKKYLQNFEAAALKGEHLNGDYEAAAKFDSELNIAVIGLGASGGLASVLLVKNPYNKIFGFDEKPPFSTLLPTGGGRCNLTYAEDDVKEFVKNYPRGNKFLLSVFSRFSQSQTRKLFEDLGIKTYVQKDKRVFPSSDSSKKTVEILRKHLGCQNFKYIKENVIKIEKLNGKFILHTKKSKYEFDVVIIASGGKNDGFELAKQLGHNIIKPVPSLCALDIEEKNFYKLSGLTFKNVEAKVNKYSAEGDILFAHKFITGPCIFKISSLCAYDDLPFEITLKLTKESREEIEEYLKNNPVKTIKKAFSRFAPEAFISEILKINSIEGTKQTAQIKKAEKEILINSLTALKLHVKGRIKDSEIVTAGGVDLNEINSKTMESKLHNNLYFIGEILNIDGFTGGFNLQNCWSGAYLCAKNIN